MRKIDARLIGGLLLVAAGFIYLLQNLGYLRLTGIVWGAAAGVAGLAFVALVISNRDH